MIDKNKEYIGQMFDEISPYYDHLNHLFSAKQDIKWRKRAIRYLLSQNIKGGYILDLATGTGDLALEFLKLNPTKIFSVDLSYEMLRINRAKLNSERNVLIRAEAEHLPFDDNFIDVTGIAFGVRNFESLGNCLKEIKRVIKQGGIFITIEMFRNKKNTLSNKLFGFYFRSIVPIAGNILSRSSYAYNYLFNSVSTFLSIDEYASLLNSSGFEVENVYDNFLGIVNTVIAVKR